MTRALNRLRDKLQRRSSANAQAMPTTAKTAEQVNWSTQEGMVVASFGGAEINYLAWTPQQAEAVIKVIQDALATLKAGK